MRLFEDGIKYAFGGYVKDSCVRTDSTSGGAFTAIVDAYCDEDYVIFGAEADGINVAHTYITDKKDLGKFRKSKYSQSKLGNTYIRVRDFLNENKKVLFSGTPCQVAGLKMFLNRTDVSTVGLLLVEVVCEGVPSPLYIRKYAEKIAQKYDGDITAIDYRFTGKSCLGNGKWDFQVMRTELNDKKKEIVIDRWFNPFWSIWLNHLMSRPACNECIFAQKKRTADITLGDLWGVHLYCPELYGKNGGASVIFANTDKGKAIVNKAQQSMFGHELNIEDALRYQSPMRKHIEVNPQRAQFMSDLKSGMDYDAINRRWAKKPTLKLLWNKYVWGNRQKIWLWNLTKGKYEIK